MQELFHDFGVDAGFLYQAMEISSRDYIYIWDIGKDTFLVSRNMVEDFDLPDRKLEHYMDKWLARIHERDINRVKESFRKLMDGGGTRMNLEYQIHTASGRYIWVSSKGLIRRDQVTDRPTMLVGVMHDLEHDGKIDHVTGLFNQEKCREHFEAKTSGRLGYQGAVLLLGIDDFTNINTLNNHSFGDLVLRTTVQDIQVLLPEDTALYRFDGDQFAIVGDGLTDTEMMDIYARIQEYTRHSHELNRNTYRFTVSAGLIKFPTDGRVWSDLEKGGMVALQKAKENGKNQCVAFTSRMLEETLQEQTLSRYLSESVANGCAGFRVVFQPVCGAGNLNITGAEALLRFDAPDGRTVSPLEFIPLLENSHLIIPVGMWVLEQAIIVCKRWLAFIPDFVMNVNVSYVQLRDPNFCPDVENLLKFYKLNVANLTLELTESYFITDASNINASLERLMELHLALAMDDFGTGYSSLARLSQFHVDVVKIDKIFVQSLHKNQYNRDFVDSVVRLCHGVGMKVCVEGVETREEQKSISMLNVDYIQGFYVSKPLGEQVFYDTFIRNPFANEKLIVLLDKESRHRQLVSDKELLLSMMDATPLCLNIWNRDYEILACNEEILNLFEVKSFGEFRENFDRYSPAVQPDGQSSHDKVKNKITEAFALGRVSFQWMHRKADGSPIPTEVTLVRIPYQNDYIVVSYTRDMRDQRQIEEHDREVRDRLKAMLDATPLCLNLWNRKFQNIMCNKEAAILFDLDSEKEYIDHFMELSTERQPDGSLSSEKAIEKIKEAFHTGRAQFYWTHRKLDGELIPSEITLVRLENIDDESGDLVAGYTRDLRPQLAAERAERIASRRIKAVIDSTPLVCILWNTNAKLIDCNQIALDMFEVDSKEAFQEYLRQFKPVFQPDGMSSQEKWDRKFAKTLETGSCIFEWMFAGQSGEEIPCEVHLVKLLVEEEDIVVAYGRDLRELRKTLEMNARLSQIAYRDTLTGCASRASFLERLDEEWEMLDGSRPLVVMIFDLDDFKAVNDTFGHDAGDQVLQMVVEEAGSILPPEAMLGRFGGDEFVILMKGLNRDQAGKLMQQIVARISRAELPHGENSIRVSISLGGALWCREDDSREALIKRADEALYSAKSNGRNCWVLS